MRTRARLVVLPVLMLLAGLLVAVATTSPASAGVQVIAVPTSNAGLGRITTAPDGSLWFAEEDANRVGRITAAGQLQEFALPPTDSSVEGPVQDLDVGPDGTVWVITEHGSNLVRMSPDGAVLSNWVFPDYDGCAGETCPYGGKVRVAADGWAWVTMNFGSSFVVKVSPTGQLVRSPNAPACGDVLGEASDGAMWCQAGAADAQGSIVRLQPGADGGTTYPVGRFASYPQGLAAGPAGSIWFTRSTSKSWFLSRDEGAVGYVDAASGVPTVWETGSRTAPQDLVMGPDRAMWFTNGGAEPAIGHISADGVGHITKVGGYEPVSLAFGSDGAVWFTDATNNVIVRVSTDQLQTTNVDYGTGATMRFGSSGPGATTAGTLPPMRAPLRLKRQRVALRVTCPGSATAACAGTLDLRTAMKVAKPGSGPKGRTARRAVARPRDYRVEAGRTATVRVRLSRTGIRYVPARGAVRLRVSLTPTGGSDRSSTRVVRVRR